MTFQFVIISDHFLKIQRPEILLNKKWRKENFIIFSTAVLNVFQV